MEWVRGDLIDVARERGLTSIAFTANAVVNPGQGLVMGRGAALRVRDAFPGAAQEFGASLRRRQGKSDSASTEVLPDYWVHGVESRDSGGRAFFVIAVQVKRHWRDDGDWRLTRRALENLVVLSRAMAEREDHHRGPIVLNCPLIGAGGFAHREDEVVRLIEETLGHTDTIVCRL